MPSKIVLVETQAQADALQAVLGTTWEMHIIGRQVADLPHERLGIRVAEDFRPEFMPLPQQAPVLLKLKQALAQAKAVYIATAPTAYGEMLGWLTLQLAGCPERMPIYRVWLNSLQTAAIRQTFLKPRPLDKHLVEAALTEKTLERLISYLVTPALTKRLGEAITLTPIIGAALRLLAEREKARIANPVAPQWWTWAELHAHGEVGSVRALLQRFNGSLPQERHSSYRQAEQVTQSLQRAEFSIVDVQVGDYFQFPLPPHTLSSLAVAITAKLPTLTLERLREILFELYEQGWISYPITHDPALTSAVLQMAQSYLTTTYGEDCLPGLPNRFSLLEWGNEQKHGAIRPLHLEKTGEELTEDLVLVYRLIRERFLLSQLKPAQYRHQLAVIQALSHNAFRHSALFTLDHDILSLAGWQAFQTEATPVSETKWVELKGGQKLELVDWDIAQRGTSQVQAYTLSEFGQALSELGFTDETLLLCVRDLRRAGYLQPTSEDTLIPTPLALRVAELVEGYFPEFFAPQGIATLFDSIQQVATGRSSRLEVIGHFWGLFQPILKNLNANVLRWLQVGDPLPELCPHCEGQLYQKGTFVHCEHFPRCGYQRGGKRTPLVLHALTPMREVAHE